MNAFVQSIHFGANRLSLANTSPQKRYFPRKVEWKRLQPHATVAGWKETRLTIPDLKIASNDPQTTDLPGIHFEEPPRITVHDLLNIVRGDTPDEWVNEILRTLFGWRKLDDGTWNDELVSPEWKRIYPDGPPNFIGSAKDYSPTTDRPVKLAVQRMSRSIPSEYKQLLKEVLRPLGFSGWKIEDLTPNRTRRAMAVSWILYWYRVHYPGHEWY